MKFFGGFEYKINKSGRIKELREFATTPRLISLMNENPELVATDATHNTSTHTDCIQIVYG